MTKSYYTIPLLIIISSMALLVIVLNYDLQADQNEILSASTSRTIYEGTRQVLELKQQQQEDNNIKYREMPDAIRVIYISSWIAGTPSLRNNLISFIENSEINSVIIDIKDSTGVISFPLNEPLVNQYHSPSIRIRDIEALLKKLHEKNIYVIGRLTAFQDPALAKKHPELALKRIDNGEIWKDKKGLAFINPKKEAAWEYLVAIAKESYKTGFNEINFDYIRYPSDGNISNINYDLDDGEKRSDTMKKFYQYLDKNLREQNIPISADVFGLTTTAQDDLGIGQIFEDILPYFDAVAPMVYPSHYSSGFFGFNNPEAHPYEVVYTAMNSGYTRAVSMGEDPQKLRPWIQDFSLGLPYGQKEVKDQIRAIYDSGLDSYMVWDPKNKYTKEAYTGNID